MLGNNIKKKVAKALDAHIAAVQKKHDEHVASLAESRDAEIRRQHALYSESVAASEEAAVNGILNKILPNE